MRKKITLFLFSISLVLTSNAQSVSSKNDTGKLILGDQNNITNAAIHSASAIFSSFKESNIPNDSISGMCSFNGGTCNGAEIALSIKGKRIFTTTLTSMGIFKISNLKANEIYILELTWAKKNLSKTKLVEAGEYVEIKL
jgi:hypothetical protein